MKRIIGTNKEWNRRNMQVYAITDRQWLNGHTLEEEVEKVLRAGATFLQLREKNLTHEELVAEGKRIKQIADKYQVPFVINDDIYAAKEIDADGVHIGQSDMDYEEARRILGKDKIIGMTAATPELAKKAEQLGADYIGVGSVFHTTTKKDAKDMDRETLLAITDSVEIPIVAIGGITQDNLHKLQGTGIDGVAVISAIFANENVEKATKDFVLETKKCFYSDAFALPAAIFDMDGTIMDSMTYWEHLIENYVVSRGYIITDEQAHAVEKMTVNEAIQFIKDTYGLSESIEQITKDLLAVIKNQYATQIPTKAATVRHILRLNEAGTRMCILTSSEEECAKVAMQRCGLLQCFEKIFTSDGLKMSKKDSRIYTEVCRQMNFEPNTTAVYEDVLHGITSAKQAGCKVVAVYDSYSAKDWDDSRKLADGIIWGDE